MAYNSHLAERISALLQHKKVAHREMKMFGGLCYMVDEKMCIGIVQDELMARIDPNLYEASLLRKGASQMNFTGRPMKGFLFINAEGTDMDEDLEYWINLSLAYNPMAKASKKR